MRARTQAETGGRTFDNSPVASAYRKTYYWSVPHGTWKFLGSTELESKPMMAGTEPMIGTYTSVLYEEKKVSLMDDVPGGWKLGGYKPVDHTKVNWKILEANPDIIGYNVTSDVYQQGSLYYYDVVTYYLDHNSFAACHLVKRLKDEEEWLNEEVDVKQALQIAYDIAKPRAEDLSEGFQGAVFFAELRDTKRIIKSLKSAGKMLKTLRHQCHLKNLGTTFDEFKWSFAKLGADTHLTWAYAIEPFLRDLDNLWTCIYGLDAYIRKWNIDAKYGTWRLRHVDISEYIEGFLPQPSTQRCTTFETGSDWEFTIPSGMEHDSLSMTIAEQVKREAKVIYTLAFKPGKIDDLAKRWGRDYNKFAMRFDALGLGDPASIAWNLIPFSFLIDYVSTADEFFSQFGADLFQMPVEDMGGGFSIKKKSSITFAATSTYCDSKAAGTIQLYQRHAVDSFGRTPGELYDVQSAKFRWEWPSLKQFSRVISLVVSLSTKYK